MFIDTHAHIYSEEFEQDKQAVMAKALEASIQKIYMPNIDHTSIDRMMEMEHQYPAQCIAMMGLHPCYVKKDFEKELYLVEDWLGKRPFAAVGEIGIDLHWDKTTLPKQEEAFKVQIALAQKYKLPIVIHCRNSFRETMDLLKQVKNDSLSGIFHCFSGSAEEAKEVIEIGFYLGIGGVSTFKNGGLDQVLPETGLDRLVLETDCPYLAPVPYRGKRNEPSYIPLIAARVAEITKTTIEEIAAKTSENALKIFAI